MLDKEIKGRSSILVLVTLLAGAAIGQLFDGLGSDVLLRYGQQATSIAWSIAVFVSFIMIWAARLWPGPFQDDVVSLEVIGILLMCVPLIWYNIVVLSEGGPKGKLIITAIIVAVVVNSIGRAVLLALQLRSVKKRVS